MSLFGGGTISNVDGDDLWVTEGGSTNQPEAFMMRVSTDGGASWSRWVYRFAQVAYDPDGNGAVAFITGFDLVKDFKLPPDAGVDRIQLQNAINSDRVENARGQGAVIFPGDPKYS